MWCIWRTCTNIIYSCCSLVRGMPSCYSRVVDKSTKDNIIGSSKQQFSSHTHARIFYWPLSLNAPRYTYTTFIEMLLLTSTFSRHSRNKTTCHRKKYAEPNFRDLSLIIYCLCGIHRYSTGLSVLVYDFWSSSKSYQ